MSAGRLFIPITIVVYVVATLAWTALVYFRGGFFLEAHPQWRHWAPEGGAAGVLLLPPLIPVLAWIALAAIFQLKRKHL